MNLTERAQEIERLQAHNKELRETLSAERRAAIKALDELQTQLENTRAEMKRILALLEKA